VHTINGYSALDTRDYTKRPANTAAPPPNTPNVTPGNATPT